MSYNVEDLFALHNRVWETRDGCPAHYPRYCPDNCDGAGRHDQELADLKMCECWRCRPNPRDQNFDIQPVSIIAVQHDDQTWKQRVDSITRQDVPIVPRKPKPPWWRPFARRKWRVAGVGPTMPTISFRTEDPFWQGG